MTTEEDWEGEGGHPKKNIEVDCMLGEHSACNLQQFYGNALDCQCNCHNHPSMVGP
jgi:hypothetical protein